MRPEASCSVSTAGRVALAMAKIAEPMAGETRSASERGADEGGGGGGGWVLTMRPIEPVLAAKSMDCLQNQNAPSGPTVQSETPVNPAPHVPGAGWPATGGAGAHTLPEGTSR